VAGNETAGVGVGQDIIANSSYQVLKTISAANGLSADLHEFQLTPWGSALITAEYPGVPGPPDDLARRASGEAGCRARGKRERMRLPGPRLPGPQH
jgi:hypothetical protein